MSKSVALGEVKSGTGRKQVSAAYGASIVAGAVLVFQIQPVVGKLLLPYFGGGASVWTACMFFFQLMLLAGYCHAHLLTRIRRIRYQAILHWVTLAISLVFLPISINTQILYSTARDPGLAIVVLLLTSIGLPFLVVASTAPLMQRWSSMTNSGYEPYRLYALSNIGALLILILYPLAIEPNLSLGMQRQVWSFAYVVYVMSSASVGFLVWKQFETDGMNIMENTIHNGGNGKRSYKFDRLFLIVLFSALGVVVLLAVTNQTTQNIAPIPFLWVIPLALYLLSFAICFLGKAWYDRSLWGVLFAVSVVILVLLYFFGSYFGIFWVIAAYMLVLFCVCMVCHGELFRLRPEPDSLTMYYLLIAIGGVLGGAFVSIVAPLVFSRHWEALLGVYVVYLLLGYVQLRHGGREIVGARQSSNGVRSGKGIIIGGLWFAGAVALPALVVFFASALGQFDVTNSRNFYGLLSVKDVVVDGVARRNLVDGTTIHGYQLTDGLSSRTPTSYFREGTGVGLVLKSMASKHDQMDVGIIGLGAGTLAAYGRPTDRYRFYELNPAVVRVADQYFSFVKDSEAEISIVVGDARMSMEEELRQSGSRAYDVLVIDAFTSDAIPVHLLTEEALEVYWSHLNSTGVLAFHISNNYFDLSPVIANISKNYGKQAFIVRSPAESGTGIAAEWVVVTDNMNILKDDSLSRAAHPIRFTPDQRDMWTDDYSNLLGTLKKQ